MAVHKAKHIAGHLQDLLGGVVAIGGVGPVTQIEDVFLGQQFLHPAGHAEAADARIDHADGVSLLVYHKWMPP